MSLESNKEQKMKNKLEPPKEKRKPRNTRAVEKKLPEKPFHEVSEKEKSVTDTNSGPEVMKLSEESSAKYSKKVIQSNWQKYEAPIDTYEEREQIENMGADFEDLLNAPISSGGYFQFKHEKTWDTPVQSTQYDKHFEINMSDLAVSLSSIPFYERNNLKTDLFSESDMVSMKARSEKFKHQMKRGGDHSLDDDGEIILHKLKGALTLNANERSKNTIDQNILEEDNIITDSDTIEGIVGQSKGRKLAQNTPPQRLAGPVEDEDLEEWLDEFLVSSKR